jgi:sugar phosphate isomerase/epimerase
MISGLGLTVFSVHQSISTLFNISIREIEELFGIANKLKAEIIVLHINVIGNQIFDNTYIQELKDLERKYRIKIGIENSPISPLTVFNKYTWNGNKFSNLMKEKGFNITFDVTHLAQTGKDIVDFYKVNKNRIVNIHLSNYKENFLNKYLLLSNGTHLPLGKGTSPIKQLLNVLKQTNYNGVITMEISGSLQELCESAKFIKSAF